MTERAGFRFSHRWRVRYAEIDGQKIVFNSRYLEYADVALTEFWVWSDIASLGPVWTDADFHIRHVEVDYLHPFCWGDEVEAFVRVERVGTSSLTMRVEMVNPRDGRLCNVVTLVSVAVHLGTGRPVPLPQAVRSFADRLRAPD